MRRLIKPLFWSALFLVLLLALDQVLVQAPSVHPAQEAVSRFYRDFRGRLIGLITGDQPAAPASIEAVIAKEKAGKLVPPASPTAEKAPPSPAQRYVYADAAGELQFADSLEAVPLPFRRTAEPLSK